MQQSAQPAVSRKAPAILIALVIMMTTWAVATHATAHSSVRAQRTRSRPPLGDNTRALPAPVRFREETGRGLLVRAWVNGTGPFTFALDTGAGMNIISPRTARAAGVAYTNGQAISITGLSGAGGGTGREATVRSLALGDSANQLPARPLVVVTDTLPPDLDGVIDPSESYYPLGYTIDLPANTISAFDPRTSPVRASDAPPDGTVVGWLTEGSSRRPFVRLDNGRRALIDTGSGFGLALHEAAARSFGVASADGRERAGVRDLGRGHVAARRIAPLTVQLGELVLRRVPTDLLLGASTDAPVILGRDALRPFQLTFDPVHRFIRIAPR